MNKQNIIASFRSAMVVLALLTAFIAGCLTKATVTYAPPVVNHVVQYNLDDQLKVLRANNDFVVFDYYLYGSGRNELTVSLWNGDDNTTKRFKTMQDFEEWYAKWKSLSL